MKQSNKTYIDSRKKYNFLAGLLTVLLVVGMAFSACEGPAGSEGPQGPEGPEGPVGPAGENGSMMHAGAGDPADNVGEIGDYYLNQDSGELYGPKNNDGWGNPIIVLMGEDGQDGADGSQIHSGSGTPDVSLGVEGDYYLDEDSYDLYGPKGDSGWGTPLNLKGADGNANVTRYLYFGHDFRSMISVVRYLDGLESEAEMRQSAWLIYFIYENSNGPVYYSVPGYGYGDLSFYSFHYSWNDNNQEVSFNLRASEGSGEEYDQIEIIRIEAGNTVDNQGSHGKRTGNLIPNHLDVTNYEEVARYYSF